MEVEHKENQDSGKESCCSKGSCCCSGSKFLIGLLIASILVAAGLAILSGKQCVLPGKTYPMTRMQMK